MRIVFMGTPDFAVPSLQALIDQNLTVAGVFTQADKPKGRGHKLQAPPVKQLALANEIPVFQPDTLRDGEAFKTIQDLNPDLIAVVAYGKILPKEILELPKLGCVNVHGSLLPKYRGAAPIQWAVLNGEAETGVTTMYMAEGLDTGDMLLRESTLIDGNETAGQLFDRLAAMGATLLVKTVKGLRDGTIQPDPQDEAQATYAPMLSKADCEIDWTASAQTIHNRVRGLQDWPVAATTYEGTPVKLHQTRLCPEKSGGKPGEVLEAKRRLIVACGNDEAIELTELQVQGKKRMSAEAFLPGARIAVGTKFGA